MKSLLYHAITTLACLLTSAVAAETTLASPPRLVPYPIAGGSARVCTGGTFDACVNDMICTQSFPESCLCKNGARMRCASACGAAKPELQNCV
ncbi:hypothetical protein HOY82DRAFT_559108 [Tuber indicum]|nr:hypothetical protein HOY82DRAFT_559108 [Tuber indicum]